MSDTTALRASVHLPCFVSSVHANTFRTSPPFNGWLICLKKKWINLTRSPDLRDTQISTWYRGKINGQGNWDHAWHKQHLFCKVSYIWRKYRHFDWLSVFSHNQTNSGEQPGTVIQCYNHLCFKLRDLQTRKMITHVLLVVLVICLIYFYRYVRVYSWYFFLFLAYFCALI